jgi:putative FmdB family regulatory protein
MPLYRYVCDKCDQGQEEHRKIEDRDRMPSVCPSCGATGLFYRETEAPAFLLKGAGWHNQEYNKHRRRKD